MSVYVSAFLLLFFLRLFVCCFVFVFVFVLCLFVCLFVFLIFCFFLGGSEGAFALFFYFSFLFASANRKLNRFAASCLVFCLHALGCSKTIFMSQKMPLKLYGMQFARIGF